MSNRISPILVAFLFLSRGFVAAQPVPKLASLSPEWVQRGRTVEVVLTGENLGSVTRFVFGDNDGLSATNLAAGKSDVRFESSAGIFSTGGAPSDDKRLVTQFTLPAEATLGSHEVRVITPTGVSNPLTIRLGDQREIIVAGDHNSIEHALPLELPAGISGAIRDMAHSDYFRFKARQGEHVLFDVNAARLGSALDSSLSVLSTTGQELARNEDFHGMDSFIDFLPPADGDYILQIRDFEFRGGPTYKYHLVAGALPYLRTIFPLGGQRGKPVELTLKGENLDGTTTMKLTVDARAPLSQQDIRAKLPRGVSNPMAFDISDYPEFIETEPNESATNATLVTVPGNINGRLQNEHDVDTYRFKANKGQRLILQIMARQFGSPLDAVVTVTGTNGNILQRNNAEGAAEARIDFTAPEMSEYFVSVRDLLDRGGENFVYRLAIRPPPEASFTARILADTPRVSRAGRSVVRVEVTRAGFAGPIEIQGESLPAGVQALPLLIPSDAPGGNLEIAATEDASLGSFPLSLNAVGVMNGRRVVEPVQAVSGVRAAAPVKRGRAAAPVAGKAVKAAYLTVLDEPPFTVDWVSLSGQLEQNQSGAIQAEIQRRPGFDGEVKVSLEGFSAGPEPITRSVDVAVVTLRTNATRADFKLKARLDSETGTRPVFARAEAVIDGQTYIQYSRPLPFTITEYPFVLANSLPRLTVTPQKGAAASEAAQADFSVKVSRRGLFNEEIALSFEGLPEGVTLTQTNLLRGTGEALLKLVATEKTKPNTTNTLVILGTATVNGRTFQQRAPGVILVVNSPAEMDAPAKVAAASGGSDKSSTAK